MRTSLSFALLGAAASLALCVPASAQQARSVVELFTSQGCSSCPPADKLAAALAQRPDVVLLSFPVDYWDYIGWKDTLASPAFTARQKAYASARGDRSIYTPQAVVDGLVHVVGSDESDLKSAMTSTAGKSGALSVPVQTTLNAGKLGIDVGAATSGARKANVWMIETLKSETVPVGRGENSGHTLTYTNVARKVTLLGEWSGEAKRFDIAAPASSGNAGWAVLVQAGSSERPGAILGAAKGP